MTRDEAIKRLKDAKSTIQPFQYVDEAIDYAVEVLKQQLCETIKEIPKDYKYDTETKDFLVYRHMYTGHEIHIEKLVPRYRLEQEPCEDCISRQAVDELSKELVHTTRDKADFLCNFWEGLRKLPPVTSKPKTGHWIEHPHEAGENWEYSKYECSECHVWENDDSDYCPNCGAKMESEDKE